MQRPDSKQRRDIIVIGGSAGGIEALKVLVRGLPGDLQAAVFVVVHLSPDATSSLPIILERAGRLPARHPFNGERYESGVIYVAPPDRHLVLRDGQIELTAGPRENRARPAVDVLFRSAAAVAGPRVIGVILSGGLSDGTIGLAAIARAGGVTIVQDPDEALSRGMPENAIQRAPIDYVRSVREIPALVCTLLNEPAPMVPAEHPVPPDAHQYGLSCPECHGILVEADESGVPVFVCRVGHRFAIDDLVAAQKQGVETAVWIAIRSLEEQADFARQLSRRYQDQEQHGEAKRFTHDADEASRRAALGRRLLESESPMRDWPQVTSGPDDPA